MRSPHFPFLGSSVLRTEACSARGTLYITDFENRFQLGTINAQIKITAFLQLFLFVPEASSGTACLRGLEACLSEDRILGASQDLLRLCTRNPISGQFL